MNLAEVSNRLVVQLTLPEKKLASRGYNRSGFLNPFDTSVLDFPAGRLNLVAGGKINQNIAGENKTASLLTDVDPADTAEVFFMTQVILNTLNSEPDGYHNMFDIPGLELQSHQQLHQVADYLISQGWIELKDSPEELLVKLTIPGKLYLSINLT